MEKAIVRGRVVAVAVIMAPWGLLAGLNATIGEEEVIAVGYPSPHLAHAKEGKGFAEPAPDSLGTEGRHQAWKCMAEKGNYYYHGQSLCIKLVV